MDNGQNNEFMSEEQSNLNAQNAQAPQAPQIPQDPQEPQNEYAPYPPSSPYPPQPYTPYDPYAYGKPISYPGKGFCVAALVLGIIGVCGSLIPAILGIIFGAIGRKKSSMALGAPSKMATAGLVCGIVGIGMYMLILACTCSLYTELIEAMLEMEEGMY